MDLVDAQQARRVLDRLVAIRFRLFCGRRSRKAYQQGAYSLLPLKLIIDRENEIKCLPARRILDN